MAMKLPAKDDKHHRSFDPNDQHGQHYAPRELDPMKHPRGEPSRSSMSVSGPSTPVAAAPSDILGADIFGMESLMDRKAEPESTIDKMDRETDESSRESFPASDPPSSTGTRTGRPHRPSEHYRKPEIRKAG